MPKYETGDLPKTYETGDLPDPTVGATPVNPGGGADVARRDMTGRSPLADAKEFGLSSLPALGAAGAVALTAASGGTAAPLTAPLIAAMVGGFTGKGVEMGLRTGTGIGAETVPPTTGSRLLEAGKSGLEQSMFEAGAGIAYKAAERVALATVRHATTSELGRKLIQEQRTKTAFDAALAKNDAKIADLEKGMEDSQALVEQSRGAARVEAQRKLDALAAKKAMIQSQAKEQAFRVGQVEAAQQSVNEALAATGAGTPGAGMTKAAYEKSVGGLAKEFEKHLIEDIGGKYVGLEQEALTKATAPVDVRPLFQRTVNKIRAIPKLEGTGGQFTEINKILSQLETDFNKFATGKKAAVSEVTEASPLVDATGKPMSTTRKIVSDAVDAVDQNQTLAGLLVMQGGLNQAAAKVAMEGKSGERTARILRGLVEDTDTFIKAEMVKQGWKDGPSTLDAVRKAWNKGSEMMEQQAFQLIKKAPDRVHELLDASSGYTPVLKKVLKDTGSYDAMWPEIRRRWIEDQFVKGGTLDARGFLDGLEANRSIINEIFDTPKAQLQLRRLTTAAGKIDSLTNGVTKNVGEYAKMEAFKDEILKIGDELATVERNAAAQAEEAIQAGKMRNEVYREKLASARGVEREALKNAYEARLKDLGLASNKIATQLFGPVPKMLLSRGSAGLVMGGAAGMLGGGTPNLYGALGGLAAGYALQRGEVALTKRLIHIADDPVAYENISRVLDSWRREATPKTAQALRLAILGYEGGKVVRDIGLAPSH